MNCHKNIPQNSIKQYYINSDVSYLWHMSFEMLYIGAYFHTGLQIPYKMVCKPSYFLYVIFLFQDKAACTFSGPQCRPEAWRICGSNRQPVCPPEHGHHWHCQHCSERRQRVGSSGFWHGLHPDRCYFQCEIIKILGFPNWTTCQIFNFFKQYMITL